MKWILIAYGSVAAVMLIAVGAVLAPEPAQAACGLSPGCWAGTMVEKIFGVDPDGITGTFVQWLTEIDSPGLTSGGPGSDVYDATRSFGFAALGAVLTLSTIHFWAAGLSSQGSGAGIALDGMLRTAGAALFILAWPWVIDSAAALAATLKDELIPGAKLDMLNVAIEFDYIVFGIVISLAYAVLTIVLYAYKVVLSAGLLTIAVGMPLALAVWALPGLSFIASGMLKWCAVIIAVPIAWSVEVALFAQVPEHVMTWTDGDTVIGTLGYSITMLALLFLMLITPSSVMKLAGMGGGRGFFAFAAIMGGRAALGALGGRAAGGAAAGAGGAPDPDAMATRTATLEGQTATARGAAAVQQGDASVQAMQQKLDQAQAAQTQQSGLEAGKAARPEFDQGLINSGPMADNLPQGLAARAVPAQTSADLMAKEGTGFSGPAVDSSEVNSADPARVDGQVGAYGHPAPLPSPPTGADQPGPAGAPSSIGAVDHEYGALSDARQAEVSQVVWEADSALEASQHLGWMAQQPGLPNREADALRSLARADHDLRETAIPALGPGPLGTPSGSPAPAPPVAAPTVTTEE